VKSTGFGNAGFVFLVNRERNWAFLCFLLVPDLALFTTGYMVKGDC
jgi:hypothetical protein